MRPGINNGETAEGQSSLLARISAAGMRVTGPRKVVVGEIARQRSSFTAAELLESVRRCAPQVGRATVFRTLDLLVEHGALRRVHTESGPNWGHSYVLCGLADAHHHHLVCTVCGQVSDFAGCSVEGLIEEVKERSGFRVQGHHLELYGECEACQRR